MYIVFFLICLIACFIGSISGLSGGVIIKPVLDSFGIMSVSEISFLSGCTALTMAIVSLIRSRKRIKEFELNLKICISLGIGASIGGFLGNQIFEIIKNILQNDNKIGLIQSILLFIMNLFIYIYIKNKSRIKSYIVTKYSLCILTGIFLGVVSSFLGIGGGPLNVALLYILFSMSPKQATLSSIIIVFFSQSSSFLNSLIRGLPNFNYLALLIMCIGAIIGALVGSHFSKKMDNEKTEKFFIKVLILLLILNIYNILKFSGIL